MLQWYNICIVNYGQRCEDLVELPDKNGSNETPEILVLCLEKKLLR